MTAVAVAVVPVPASSTTWAPWISQSGGSMVSTSTSARSASSSAQVCGDRDADDLAADRLPARVGQCHDVDARLRRGRRHRAGRPVPGHRDRAGNGERVRARRTGPEPREQSGFGGGAVGGRRDADRSPGTRAVQTAVGGDRQGRVLPRDEVGLADGQRRELVPELLAGVGHPAGRADQELVGQVGTRGGMVGRESVGKVGRDRDVVGGVERHDRDRDGRRHDRRDRGRIGCDVPFEPVVRRHAVDEDVARGVHRAGHRVDARDPFRKGRIRGQRVLDVRPRAERDDRDGLGALSQDPGQQGRRLLGDAGRDLRRDVDPPRRVGTDAPLVRERSPVGPGVLAPARDGDVRDPELPEEVHGVAQPRRAMDQPGSVKQDRPDVERGVPKQDSEGGDVAAVEIEVDDDRPAACGSRRRRGRRAGGRHGRRGR